MDGRVHTDFFFVVGPKWLRLMIDWMSDNENDTRCDLWSPRETLLNSGSSAAQRQLCHSASANQVSIGENPDTTLPQAD